jgi:hypothetical protein
LRLLKTLPHGSGTTPLLAARLCDKYLTSRYLKKNAHHSSLSYAGKRGRGDKRVGVICFVGVGFPAD